MLESLEDVKNSLAAGKQNPVQKDFKGVVFSIIC